MEARVLKALREKLLRRVLFEEFCDEFAREMNRLRMKQLAQALEHPDTRTEAAEAIQGLIHAIVPTPWAGALETHVVRRGRPASSRGPAKAGRYDGADTGLQIELKGNLAAMLSAAQNARRSPETGDLELQIAMVAGAGFEPATFGL